MIEPAGQHPVRSGPLGPLLPVAWLAAFALALGFYLAWNPPLHTALLRLAPVGFAGLVMVAFLGLGAPLVRRLMPQTSRTDERLAAIAVGAGLSAVLVFVLGLAGVMSRPVAGAWLGLGLALAAVELVHRPPRLPAAPSGWVGVAALVVIALTLAAIIPMLAAPAATTDELEYHLLVPKAYLALGRIEVLPGFLESNYPSLMEYLYMLVLPLAGPVACKGLHFWFGLALLVAIARLAARVAPEGSRVLAPALYISMPVAALVLGWAWNDATFVLLLMLMFHGIVDYHLEDPAARRAAVLVQAGVMAGLASWTKYTFVMVALALVPVAVAGVLRWRWRLRHLLAFAVPVGLISMLWLAKNWAFTGNPVFPFLNGIFASPLWNPAAESYFRNALTRYEMPGWHWTTAVLVPFRMVLQPRLIDVHTGVLPLLLIPLAFVRGLPRGAAPLRAFLVGSVAAWLVIQTEARSLLTCLAVLAVIGAAAAEVHLLGSHRLRRAFLVLLAGAVAANLVVISVTAFVTFDPVRYLIGAEGTAGYLQRSARAQDVYDWLDARSTVRGVLLVGLHGPFYLERPVIFSSFCDPPVAERVVAGAGSVAEVARTVTAMGVSHVVVDASKWRSEHEAGLYSWTAARRELFEKFLAEACTPVARFGDVTVYAVRSF